MSSKLFLQHDTLSQDWVSSGAGTDELFSTSKLQHLLLVMFFCSLVQLDDEYLGWKAASMQSLKWKPGLCNPAFKSPLLERWGEGFVALPEHLVAGNPKPALTLVDVQTADPSDLCHIPSTAQSWPLGFFCKIEFCASGRSFGLQAESRKYPYISYMDS